MGTIDQTIKAFQFNVREELENSFLDTAVALADAQRDQMLHGLRSTGKKIGKYANTSYAREKFSIHQLAGFGYKDLFYEGDFQSEIFVDVRDNELFFTSHDPKTEMIVEREGEDIFGLSKQYAETYSKDYLEGAFVERINNKLK